MTIFPASAKWSGDPVAYLRTLLARGCGLPAARPLALLLLRYYEHKANR